MDSANGAGGGDKTGVYVICEVDVKGFGLEVGIDTVCLSSTAEG